MSEAIIVALITGVLGLLGTIYANNRAAKIWMPSWTSSRQSRTQSWKS